jgi:2,5-diketo-D-gluconate reductase B
MALAEERLLKTTDYGMPLMGLGTFGRTGSEGRDAILAALKIGYRHIDTAQTYETESECGEAFRLSGLKREEVHFTTKISTENFGPGALVPSLRKSLDRLGLDAVDLTLLHWPSPRGKVELEVYVEQIGEAQRLGLTRNIGVSNFPIALLDQARKVLGEIPIVNNQFECHPYLQNKKLVDHCREMGVSVTCYLPIARGKLAGDPVLESLAKVKDCTVEQLALAYSMARGLSVIPASANPERMKTNFAAQAVELSAEDMAVIAGVDRGTRYIDFDWAPRWD